MENMEKHHPIVIKYQWCSLFGVQWLSKAPPIVMEKQQQIPGAAAGACELLALLRSWDALVMTARKKWVQYMVVTLKTFRVMKDIRCSTGQ